MYLCKFEIFLKMYFKLWTD